MKAELRTRPREDPSRPLWLHLPVGYCRFACSTGSQPAWHVGSSHHPSLLGTQARLTPSAPKGAPSQMPALCVPAPTPPYQGQWAPAQWCHLMALSRGTWQELLSLASLRWGGWNAVCSLGLISQLPGGPESVSCAADTQRIPLLWEGI